jgi:hypothetical protein
MNNYSQVDNESDKITENFCGACLAAPLALAGAGAAGVGAKKNHNHKKMKNILLWGGISITIISIIITIVYLRSCKSCR